MQLEQCRSILEGITGERERKLAAKQLLWQHPELADALGIELPGDTRKKRIRVSRIDPAKTQTGDDRDMKQASKGSGSTHAPWTAWNGKTMRVEPVPFGITEATRRFPRAYGASWMYPEVV